MKSKEEILQGIEDLYFAYYSLVDEANKSQVDLFEKSQNVVYEALLLGRIGGYLDCLTENKIERERYSKLLCNCALKKYALVNHE